MCSYYRKNGVFNNKSNQHYSQYVQAWELESLGDAAQQHLNEAVRIDKVRTNLLRVGLVLVTGSLAGLAYRFFFKHKPKVRKFKKYCRS